MKIRKLTERQKQVALLKAMGYHHAYISEVLGIRMGSTRQTAEQVFKKYNIQPGSYHDMVEELIIRLSL